MVRSTAITLPQHGFRIVLGLTLGLVVALGLDMGLRLGWGIRVRIGTEGSVLALGLAPKMDGLCLDPPFSNARHQQ
eukprot:6051609-Pleurochrysis_carterae.AAC.1